MQLGFKGSMNLICPKSLSKVPGLYQICSPRNPNSEAWLGAIIKKFSGDCPRD